MKCLKRADYLLTPVDQTTCRLQAIEGLRRDCQCDAQHWHSVWRFIYDPEINGLLTPVQALLILILRRPDILKAISKEA